MTPQILRVGEHATLLALQTDRFKSELLNVQFAVPTKQESAQRYALLFELLRRGVRFAFFFLRRQEEILFLLAPRRQRVRRFFLRRDARRDRPPPALNPVIQLGQRPQNPV